MLRLKISSILTLFLTSSIALATDWQTVPNDPLNVQITTLENGLKVYFSVNKKEPKVSTNIVVFAGSKHDPAETTGLAHYFEHLMFKGSENFGTIDYKKEKPLLDQIEELFEVYRKTTDETKRKEIYAQIDKLSVEASKLSAPNEYDKMLNVIGATGTNAYTSNEKTVYVNTIPSNQIDSWLDIEFERFSKPVIRLFHTELETVYEEKNRAMDSDSRKLYEELLKNLFKKHQYGTQTTLGTIEDLKNPSIRNVKNFFNQHYVPNNMAIVMAGDFDPEKALSKIKSTFGQLENKTVPPYNPPKELAITEPIEKEIVGADAEKVYIGFRFPGASSKDADLLTMADMIMTNGKAGIIDLNINQQQKVLDAFTTPLLMKDYSIFLMGGSPKNGQTLEDVKTLLLEQINNLKSGNFADWLPEAVVNDFKLQTMRGFKSNKNRVDMIASALTKGVSWNQAVAKNDRLSKITKQQIVDFAKKNLNSNYAVIYKRQGKVEKFDALPKPEISKIEINEQNQSDYLKEITSRKASKVEPKFVDFDKAMTNENVDKKVQLYYIKNEENDLFSMQIVFDIGTEIKPWLNVTSALFNYLNTETMNAGEIQQLAYRKGCEFSLDVGRKSSILTITGLSESSDEIIKVAEQLLTDPKVDETAFNMLTQRIIKSRENVKTDKETILWKGMLNFAKYGTDNPFSRVVSNQQLQSAKPDIIKPLLKDLVSEVSRIYYFGAKALKEAKDTASIFSKHQNRSKYKVKRFKQKETDEQLYYYNFPGMKQVQVLLVAKAAEFQLHNIADRRLFNEYFGAGMSSLVFQQIREARALAYSTFASYTSPRYANENHYMLAFVGTQKDKFEEALSAMKELISNMPMEEKRMATAKRAIENKVRTSRMSDEEIFSTYEYLRQMNIDIDTRKVVFENIQKVNLDTLKAFHKNKVSPLKFDILILGDLTEEQLTKLKDVKTITEDDIFHY